MVLNKLLNVLLLSVAVLTGCGGGGGGSPSTPTTPITPAVFDAPAQLPEGKFRLARIDYRYDTPASQKNTAGNQTTSLEALKPMIDTIKQIGFTGVIIQLQTPVNKDTGKVSFNDGTDDKHIPKDTWRVVDYATSHGLQVWLSLQIVDSVTDMHLTTDFTKYTEQQMFNSIIEFQRGIVSIAEQHKVYGVFISEGNHELESYDHLFYWQQLINEIKKVYSGKLSYTTYVFQPTSIWNHVDYASVFVNTTLSTTPVYDLKTIISLYFNDAYNVNEVQRLKDFYMVYGKKFILTTGSLMTDSGVGYLPSTFWEEMASGNWTVSQQYNSITNQMQLLKIRAFMEIVNKQLVDITAGVGFTEFAPWLQHTNFSSPSDPIYKYYCCGWDLTNNLDAQKTLNSYFSKPWGFYYVQ